MNITAKYSVLSKWIIFIIWYQTLVTTKYVDLNLNYERTRMNYSIQMSQGFVKNLKSLRVQGEWEI